MSHDRAEKTAKCPECEAHRREYQAMLDALDDIFRQVRGVLGAYQVMVLDERADGEERRREGAES